MPDSQRPGAPESTEVQAAPPLHLLGDGNSPAGTGRYELREEIARDGMGVVFRARDRALGRDVGLKTLLTVAPAGSAVAERFFWRLTLQLNYIGQPPTYRRRSVAKPSAGSENGSPNTVRRVKI